MPGVPVGTTNSTVTLPPLELSDEIEANGRGTGVGPSVMVEVPKTITGACTEGRTCEVGAMDNAVGTGGPEGAGVLLNRSDPRMKTLLTICVTVVRPMLVVPAAGMLVVCCRQR